jgi:hypothetical protein
MEEPGARSVAQFKPNWLGGGALSFNDGERFQLVARGFWRPIWSWLNDHGQKLIEVVPNEKCVRLTGIAQAASNTNQDHLPVLIMFSWHQILQTNDDAAAAAAVSVAAG